MVLLIPGLLCDQTVWQPLLDEMGDKACVADLSSQVDITQMALDCLDRYAGVLSVAGHSMGARVAMEMARIAPERIQRMALLDAGFHALQPGERIEREKVMDFASANGMEDLADHWISGMVHTPNKSNVNLMQQLKAMVLRCDTQLHARQMQALINRPDASHTLPNIHCPVLLVVGRYDLACPVTQHEAMLKLLPDARLEVVENAGHFAQLEQAASVAQLLVEFFQASNDQSGKSMT